jgi:hypothetical protein
MANFFKDPGAKGKRTKIKLYSDYVASLMERPGASAPYEICRIASRAEELGPEGKIYAQILAKIYWKNWENFRTDKLKKQITTATRDEFLYVLDKIDAHAKSKIA